MTNPSPTAAALAAVALLALFALSYLINLNRALKSTPPSFQALLTSGPWTREQIQATHDRLARDQPFATASSYASHIPPRLGRRYIVTGGSGMVGGYIVLQLLARGEPPEAIRIVDFQPPRRTDMLSHPGITRIAFHKADLSSATQTDAAFSAPWPSVAIASLPLTVFHTAAVLIPTARSPLVAGFCDAVNVGGTAHVVSAARRASADVLVSTSSGSIAIRPVGLWSGPRELRGYAQVLDEADFFAGPVRPHAEFYANYPAAKARGERLVCEANGPEMRTGCIRPCNGVYGQATDNLVGAPLNMQTYHS